LTESPLHDLTSHAARIEIDVAGRWNARALLLRLAPYRSFLVEQGPERWVVHAQVPGCHGESLTSALAAIESCLDEHGGAEASIRIDGDPSRPAATARVLASPTRRTLEQRAV
jgi:hypothetical protein